MGDCIFCKIATKEITKDFLYEDEDVMVFPDIHPVRPIHLLIIPKKHITDLLAVESPVLFEKLFIVVKKMILEHELTQKGYRVTINGGGAQIVQHLHIHLVGPMSKIDKL